METKYSASEGDRAMCNLVVLEKKNSSLRSLKPVFWGMKMCTGVSWIRRKKEFTLRGAYEKNQRDTERKKRDLGGSRGNAEATGRESHSEDNLLFSWRGGANPSWRITPGENMGTQHFSNRRGVWKEG